MIKRKHQTKFWIIQFLLLLYSVAGGVPAYAVMAVLIGHFPDKLLWAVRALAAIAHNAAQLGCAVLVTGTPSLFWYARYCASRQF